jgi:hypothetical protein
MVLFFGLYWFFLRKEKLLIFNRYFLIFSIVLSLTVPFISLPVNLGQNNTTSDIFAIINSQPAVSPILNEVTLPEQRIVAPGITVPAETPVMKERSINLQGVLLFIYLSGFALMLIRFSRNLLIVNRMFRRSEKIDHEWYRIALLEHPVNPFSFLRTVFINKKDYLENRIAENVLRHELEHVRQSHSRDIIFFELLHIVFWFNPVLFLYKRAARINHEYLADEAVIRTFSDMKAYADELINFISTRVGVPLTSGFSPSMIRLRLLMLNTNTTGWGKGIRMLSTLWLSVLLMSFMSIKPSNNITQKQKVKNLNKDIVIEEVFFRGIDFKPTKALFVLDGKIVGNDERIVVDPKQIKTIDVLKKRKEIRKYNRNAKDGIVVITTYEIDKKSSPDSLLFKPIYTINDTVPKGKISIDVSNLYSFSLWTYPIFQNQDLVKRWQTIAIMTRDYYKIKGKAIQKNGEPIAGAMLTIPNRTDKVMTDKDGRFFMKDVKPDVVAELSADDYNSLFFKVNGTVFKYDLKVTLDKKNEPEQGNISIITKIKDFSGNWKYNNVQSKPVYPGIRILEIHQYDSDSIVMNGTSIPENDKEFKYTNRFVFNKIKKYQEVQKVISNTQTTYSCYIDPGGHSFTTTYNTKSKIGLFKEQKSTQTFSLSDDGKQMIIRNYYSTEGVSSNEKPFEQVYDRIAN